VLTVHPGRTRSFGRSTGGAKALSPARPFARWQAAGAIALLCSGVAMASLPALAEIPGEEQRQWQALGIAPLASGGDTGMRMDATDAVEELAFVAKRAPAAEVEPAPAEAPAQTGPIRIRGRVGDGLYWSLRAAGASPQVAAQFLSALATQIDVGEVGIGDGFDLVLGNGGANGALLYAGLDRVAASDLQLVRWSANGRNEWIDAANAERPAAPVSMGFSAPVAGPITSGFGSRYHPILHFTRFHAGIDFGASWGSPIVAAAAGQVVAAGWAGGYGREVRIAHGGGLTTVYGHMSGIVASPGSFVRQGQLIGYVGSSGLSTGPHLHSEVRKDGVPVNPLGVRFAVAAPPVDRDFADAVKARLHALLSVGVRRG
jgi:murein DD-endopeptidase MepM/ murein hydrolase activator NlpD